jgi:hypothetical protein
MDSGQAMTTNAPVQYSCFLDNQPNALVPRRAQVIAARADVTSLVVSRHVISPVQVSRFGAHFLGGAALQIVDSGTGATYPYWVANSEWREGLSALLQGCARPMDLPPQLIRVLTHAGILITPAFEAHCVAFWNETAVRLARFLELHRYAVLKAILHPFHVAALRQYVLAIRQKGILAPDTITLDNSDKSTPRLLGCGGEVLRYFHEQFSVFVRRVVGKPLQCNYACVVHYPSGSSLHRHRDFGHCHLAMSMPIDQTLGAPPLCFELGHPIKRIDVPLGLGDAVLYYGEELIHYRDPLPPEHSITPLIFCFGSECPSGLYGCRNRPGGIKA